VVVGDVEGVGVGIGDGGTVEIPLTDTAGLTTADPLVLAVELVDDADTVETPLTDTAGVALPETLVLDTELVDDVEALVSNPVGVTLDDTLELAAGLVADGVLLVCWELVDDDVSDGDAENVAVEDTESVVDAPVACDAPGNPDPPSGSPVPCDTVHCLTSCTCDCPLTVIGVRVITQVSFTTPEGVFFSDTVVNVTGC